MSDSKATEVLMRTIDNINEARDEINDPEWQPQYLVVAWAGTYEPEGRDENDPDAYTIRGWDATPAPTFVTCGLLREIAAKIEHQTVQEADDIDEEDED